MNKDLFGTQHLRVDAQVAHQLNRAAVFNLLRSRRVTSRIELVRETGLSKATISEIVDQLALKGFVRTVGRGEANGGRPPILLEFEPSARVAIGVQLGDSVSQVMLTDLNANPIRSLSTTTPSTSASDAISSVLPLISELRSSIPPDSLLGIGVGTPGLVDSARGVIRMAPDLGWRDVPVVEQLRAHFPLPIYAINRAKASALAEAWCGAGRNVDTLVYLSISTGIAAGIIVEGRLFRGVSMSEGEVGHITIMPDGPLCPCGNRGCLQTLAAGPALLARAREKLRLDANSLLASLTHGQPDLLTLDHLAAAAAQDDTLVGELLEEVAGYLGIGAANIVNLLNPRMFILGGRVVRALPQLVPLTERAMRRRAMPTPSEAVTVVPSELGNNVVPIGAAAFLLSQVSIVGE